MGTGTKYCFIFAPHRATCWVTHMVDLWLARWASLRAAHWLAGWITRWTTYCTAYWAARWIERSSVQRGHSLGVDTSTKACFLSATCGTARRAARLADLWFALRVSCRIVQWAACCASCWILSWPARPIRIERP